MSRIRFVEDKPRNSLPQICRWLFLTWLFSATAMTSLTLAALPPYHVGFRLIFVEVIAKALSERRFDASGQFVLHFDTYTDSP